jgi:hypothetical protein
MTKKDYIKFAEMFKEELYSLDSPPFGEPNYQAIASVSHLARQSADIFAEDNPNFNRSKFLKACGLEGEQ